VLGLLQVRCQPRLPQSQLPQHLLRLIPLLCISRSDLLEVLRGQGPIPSTLLPLHSTFITHLILRHSEITSRHLRRPHPAITPNSFSEGQETFVVAYCVFRDGATCESRVKGCEFEEDRGGLDPVGAEERAGVRLDRVGRPTVPLSA